MERSIFTTRCPSPVHSETTSSNEGPTLNANETKANSCIPNNLETLSEWRRNEEENNDTSRSKSNDQGRGFCDILPISEEQQFFNSEEPNSASETTKIFNSSEEIEWEIISVPYYRNANRMTHQMSSELQNPLRSRKRTKPGECFEGSKSPLELEGHSNIADFIGYNTDVPTQLEGNGLTTDEINVMTPTDIPDILLDGKEDTMTNTNRNSSPQNPNSQQNVTLGSLTNVFTRNLQDDRAPHPHEARSFNHSQAVAASTLNMVNGHLTLRKCGHSDSSMELPSFNTKRVKTHGLKRRRVMRAKKSKSEGCIEKQGRHHQAFPRLSLQNLAVEILKSQHPYLMVTSEAALKLETFLVDVVHRIGEEARNLVFLSSNRQMDSRVLKYAIKLTLEQIKSEGDVAAGRKNLWLF